MDKNKIINNDPKEILDILADAQEAFWGVIAERFSNDLISGDFSPSQTFQFNSTCNTALMAWLTTNKFFFHLKSVGCIIDKYGYTYSRLVNGGFDPDTRCNVSDIEVEEWFDSLSKEDLIMVNKFRD